MIVLTAIMLALGVSPRPGYYFVSIILRARGDCRLWYWLSRLSVWLEKLWVHRMIRKTRYESIAAVDGAGGEVQEMRGVKKGGPNAYGYSSHCM
jgi:hypothetical protein